MSRRIAELLLSIKAVTFNFRRPYLYTFVSGVRGPMYCDNRRLISYPAKRKVVVDEFLKVLKKTRFDVVGGVSTAGIPWAALIAERLGKPMIYIRPETKMYGKKKQIEGDLRRGDRVLIVEDLISTGGSAISSVKAVRRAGGKVKDCVFIFTYELDAARKNFERAKCRAHALLTFSQLIDIAAGRKYISGAEREKLSRWHENV